MESKIRKIQTSKGVRYELRAWAGAGERRTEWRRRFKSMADARAFVDERIYEERKEREQLRRNGGDVMKLRTFRDEHDNWRATRYRELAPGWRCNVDAYWKEVEPTLARLTIVEITPAIMRDLECVFRAAGNSKATVQRKVSWIKGVLNYAVDMERIPFNPIAKFKSTKPDKPELEFWEKSEAQSFLQFTLGKYPKSSVDHWKYLAYLVALNTGVRGGELWALRPSNLKPSFNMIYVTHQLNLISGEFRGLKGKEARSVPLSDELAQSLMEWVKKNDVAPGGLLLAPPGSKGVDHNNFAKRVYDADVKAWGGRRIKFHAFRHTAATLMLDAGVDIRTVQAILGHKNIETTMRYVHAIGHNVRKAASTFVLTPTAVPSAEVIELNEERAARNED